jgi:hypothetical protein
MSAASSPESVIPRHLDDTLRLVIEVLGTLNRSDSRPSTAREWECIAAWAVVGYLLASGRLSPGAGVVTMLMEAASVLDDGASVG